MKLYICAFVLFLSLYSCKSVEQIAYFQDIDKVLAESANNQALQYETRIQPDDLLSITVSGKDPQSVASFNLPLTSHLGATDTEVKTTPVLQSYLVDSKGFIDFPVIGKLHIEGLTRDELTDFLKEKISQYVKSPIVTVRILNFKISVIGEVNRPGFFTVPSERVTLLEAISLAGDLTIFGERTNVLLIRETNGIPERHRIDLTSAEILQSPYYYLQQNDVVYVTPNKARQKNSKYSQNSQFNVSVASTIISAVSIMVSLGIALFAK